jgi:hypothetical protein
VGAGQEVRTIQSVLDLQRFALPEKLREYYDYDMFKKAWVWLSDVRNSNIGCSPFYFPDAFCGPDLLFFLENVGAQAPGSPRLILCALQVRLRYLDLQAF